MSNSAVIIYPRISKHSTRIFNQANYLVDSGLVGRVVVVCMYNSLDLYGESDLSAFLDIHEINVSTYRLPKNAIGDSIKFSEFIIKAVNIITKLKPVVVIPHSLSVLPIGVVVKRRLSISLVYDAHELETERFNLKGFRKGISKFMESNLIKYCDNVIVVNEHIANWYRDHYKLDNVQSVPNIPHNRFAGEVFPKTTILRDELRLGSDDLLFIYQGALSKGRGIEELLKIFGSGEVSSERKIVFMGFGELEDLIKAKSTESNQIYFKSAVSPNDILKYTSGADVGLFFILDSNLCLSYQLALPNKFYEYTLAGLFICVNDRFPVMKELIEKYHLGKVIASSEDDIKQFIGNITKESILNEFEKSIDYRKKMDWGQNEVTLAKVFSSIKKNKS